MSLRALIFDFDGTIAETERHGHRAAYNAAFEEAGLDDRWDEPTYGELLAVAGGRERLEAYFASAHAEWSEAERLRRARELHAIKRRHFDRVGETIRPRIGVVRLIHEAIEGGVRVAIATTASLEGVRAFLRGNVALADAFAVTCGGDDVARKKPAPDIYALALERLGLRAHDAVAFEDSAIGLRAARAAELVTIVTPSGYTRDESFAGAFAVLDSFGEPDEPARTLAGPAPPNGVVDLAYVARALHGERSA